MKKIKKIHVNLEIKRNGSTLKPKLSFPSSVIVGKKSWSKKKWIDYAVKDLEGKLGEIELVDGTVEKEYES